MVRLEDGLYDARWPSGRPRLVACVEEGRVRRWLTLEDGRPAGCLDVGHCAQRFYADGFMEDFSPWDDSSPRYRATVPFPDWVQDALRQVRGEPEPLPPPRPAPPVRPAPPLPEILRELSAWPGDLEFRTQLEFHLRDRFRLAEADSARLAEFMPLALVPGLEEYVHPVWEGPFEVRSSRLDEVDVVREMRAARVRDARVLRSLRSCASVTEEEAAAGIRPIVAGPPPEPAVTCPLRVLEVLCELMLAAEGRSGDDATRGAYLLAPLAGAPLAYVDGVLPWAGHPEGLAKAQERLAHARSCVLSGKLGALSGFFLARATAVQALFRSFGAGRYAFPLLRRGDRWVRPGRDGWRDLALEAMRVLPEPAGAVERARMQNRLAEVGLHLSGQASERIAEELEKRRDVEPEVREPVQWFLDSDELDRPGWDLVNGVLWVLESFEPGARARRDRVVQAVRASRILATPLAR